MATTDQALPQRSKKACTQCRQQKAKCDAFMQAANNPCSRCGRLGLECLVVEGFEREHKRRKLYQLQNEAQQLRKKLNKASDNHMIPRSSVSPPSTNRDTSSHLSPEDSQGTPSMKPTLPRTRGDLLLESDEIDHLFELYFRDYAPLLPVLDPFTSPNYYYDASKALFWSVIAVASRNYDRRPELVQVMSTSILDLAKLAMTARVTIRSVQALLLLLTWPISREQGSFDPSFTLGGALLHMCIQLGLHTPFFSQDFSREKLELTAEELDARAALWAHSVITYQRCCIIKGSPALLLADITLDADQRSRLIAVLPSDLKFQLQAQDLVLQATCNLARSGLQSMSADQERAMEMIIETHLLQLTELENSVPLLPTSEFVKAVSRLSIYVQFFYQHPTQWSHKSKVITAIIEHASRVVDMVEATLPEMPVARTWYVLFGVLHATAALVRLCKTPTIDEGVRKSIRNTLERGVTTMRIGSLDPSHLPARASNFIMQCLESKKAFIHPESAPDRPQLVPLRIRSRLAMSHLLDVWCWWREEFGGLSGVYPMPLKDVKALAHKPETQQARTADAMPKVDHSDMQTLANGTLFVPDGTAVSYNNSMVPPYTSNAFMDQPPTFVPNLWPQNEMFTEIWNFWPDEDWGIPGLS